MSPASRASRLYTKRGQALSRGNEERADMLLRLHRYYVALGLAQTHEAHGSPTAKILYGYAESIRRGP